jgi:peptidase C10-like protein
MYTKQLSVLFLLFSLIVSSINAQSVDKKTSFEVAESWVTNKSNNELRVYPDDMTTIQTNGIIIGYQYDIHPVGFVIITPNKLLTPIIAYSLTGNYIPGENNPLKNTISLDILNRLELLNEVTAKRKQDNINSWNSLLAGSKSNWDFEQWPPEGTTSTGGWVESEWSQEAPYNNFCPMDLEAGSRSIAGCPSVAISMILNYTNTINGMRFTEEERYYHNYAGNGYWIDDDYLTYDFPSFQTLNNYHDSIEINFENNLPLNYDQISALVFGCGVAAKQVYSAGGSGTFGVDQAFDALQLYGFGDSRLVYDTDTSFYTQMKDNIKSEMPVLLALLVANGPGGHNVVADGYNTDNFYHLNFGWGGSYNSWYSIPNGIPYNLTIVEGAIVDIGTKQVSVNEQKMEDICNLTVVSGKSYDPVIIDILLNEAQNTDIEVFDNNGRRLCSLQSGMLPAGEHQFRWHGINRGGIYFIVAKGDFRMCTKKIVVL